MKYSAIRSLETYGLTLDACRILKLITVDELTSHPREHDEIHQQTEGGECELGTACQLFNFLADIIPRELWPKLSPKVSRFQVNARIRRI